MSESSTRNDEKDAISVCTKIYVTKEDLWLTFKSEKWDIAMAEESS